jgi:hypothetical protein
MDRADLDAVLADLGDLLLPPEALSALKNPPG